MCEAIRGTLGLGRTADSKEAVLEPRQVCVERIIYASYVCMADLVTEPLSPNGTIVERGG